MEPDALVGGKRRGYRRWLRVSLFLAVLPVGIFLLGNLVLTCPWSCRWLAAKIEHRTGMETHIGGLSWSPWNGAVVHDLELLQPAELRAGLNEPLARIHAIRLTPVWRAWLHGHLEVRSIELDSPRLVMPLEMMAILVRSGSAPQTAPTNAATPPPPILPTAPPVTAPPATKPAAGNPPPPPSPPHAPTAWLSLKNASFALVHAVSHKTLFEISKTAGMIPLAGDPARSTLTVGLISAAGMPVITNLPANLNWKNPQLALEPLNAEINGYKFVIAAKITGFSGLPLQIEFALPRQKPTPFAIPFNGQANADGVVANARFVGLLLAPGTWQGDFVIEAIAPTLRFPGSETKFDRASSITVLRHGVLACTDARLIGDELSLLGNAALLADGRAAGAVRLVAAPETAAALASHIFPIINSAPSLTPLGTPQRSAFDLQAFGNINQLFLRLGKDGPIVALKH